MLQRALAATLCVLGLVALGLAIASATVWRPADTLSAVATAEEGHLLLVTEPGVLELAANEVEVVITAPDDAELVAAVGRTDDVLAWVGDDPATHVVGLADTETLATRTVAPDADQADADQADADQADADQADADQADGGSEPVAPDPGGSDLWIEEVRGEGSVALGWEEEAGRWSVLAAAPGSVITPTITMTWPQEVRTPFLVPGVVVGSVLLLAGAVWLVLLLLGGRRRGRPAGATVATTSASSAAVSPAAVPVRPAPAQPRSAGEPPLPAAVSSAPAVGPGTGPVSQERPLTRREIRLREQAAAARGRGRQGAGPQAAAAPETGDEGARDPSPGHGPSEPPAPAAPGTGPGSVPLASLEDADGPRASHVSGEAWRKRWGLGTTSMLAEQQGAAEDDSTTSHEEGDR